MKEAFSFQLETYNLGVINRDSYRLNADPSNRTLLLDTFLFYTRRNNPVSIDTVTEETVGLDFPTYLSDTVLFTHLRQHPYLHATQGVNSRNSTILTTTRADNQVQRNMIMIPGSPGQYLPREIKPYNLQDWDSDILSKCNELPKHVRKAMGI